MKQVRFKQLQLECFTTHRELTVNYGDVTKLSGQNGQGKTSIGTAPVWIMWGKDLNGKDFNPSPVNYEYERVFASLLLTVDGTDVLLAREKTAKGENLFYINDIPKKDRQFKEFVASLFDMETFLSLYNPSFFFLQHWTKQREQILRNVLAPSNKEVFAEMSRTSPEQKAAEIKLNPYASKLAELVKKNTLDDLDAKHKKNKTTMEKAHIAAESRTKTLQEQLAKLPDPGADIEQVMAEATRLLEEIKDIEKITDSAGDNNHLINTLQTKINGLLGQRDKLRDQYTKLKNEAITDNCRVCGQDLQSEAKIAAQNEKDKRVQECRTNHDVVVAERKQLEEELAGLHFIDITEKYQEVKSLESKRNEFLVIIRSVQQREELQQQVEQARADEAEKLASLKESILILDAVKAYRAKEAELQAGKVQSLFTKLSVRLFNYIKTTGEYEPTFVIQMDDKDYPALSLGEKMEAGLELQDVLYKQSELIVPCLIDNVESYTGEIKVFGQAITSRVVAGQELKIESEGA